MFEQLKRIIIFTAILQLIGMVGCAEYENHIPSNPINELLTNDPALIGTWFTESITREGKSYDISTKIVLNADGTGFSVKEENEEIVREDFRWGTENQILKIYNSDSGFETSGFYTVGNNIHNYIYEDPLSGNFVEQVSIRQTGRIDNRINGAWIESCSYVGGLLVYNRQLIKLNENGTGSIQAAEDNKITTELIDWSVTENRILFENSSGFADVSVYNLVDDNLTLTQYNQLGQLTVSLLIYISDEIDSNFVGVWALDSRTVDGVPVTGSAIVYLNDNGAGNYSEGENSLAFTWSVNNNKLIVAENNGNVPLVINYSIEGDTAIISYYAMSEERSLQTFVEVYSRQED